MTFKNKLTDLAEKIDEIIKLDSFPETIEPDFLKAAVRDYPCRGGKRLRPALLIWTCGMVGGNTEKAMRAAAASEIWHNWTLVHDDIIDNDDFRRGVATSHKQISDIAASKYKCAGREAVKFGRDFAILTGDLQQSWAISMMLSGIESGVPADVCAAITQKMLALAGKELISGEALDVLFPYQDRNELSSSKIIRMLDMKTGALLRFCAEAGAAIALETKDFSNPAIVSCGKFAVLAGRAFQLQDDYLGIFGDEKKFGKPICSDMSASKPTVMLLYALESLQGKEKEELVSMLGKNTYTENEQQRIRELFEKSGAAEKIRSEADSNVRNALAELDRFKDSEYRKLLRDFCSYMVNRDI